MPARFPLEKAPFNRKNRTFAEKNPYVYICQILDIENLFVMINRQYDFSQLYINMYEVCSFNVRF